MTPKEFSCLNWHGDSFHMKGEENGLGRTTACVNDIIINLLLKDFLKRLSHEVIFHFCGGFFFRNKTL